MVKMDAGWARRVYRERKTTKKKIKEIKNFFLVNHPYETPELIVLNVHAEQKYLEWMLKETDVNE